MDQNWTAQQKEAMEALELFLMHLCENAGKPQAYGAHLWEQVSSSEGLLRELAYFHDTGSFWGQYRVAGLTLPDLVVWQVDHFKAYMDREENNRYHRERLFLESFESLAQLERDPETILRKFREETGTDF